MSTPPPTPPITTNSTTQFPSSQIRSDAASTNITIHPRLPSLLTAFLTHKRTHGSTPERALYTPTFTWQNLTTRLIEKRPLVFMGHMDHTVLRDGTMLERDPRKEWDRNGTDKEHLNEFLRLEKYLSYDEIMLSSLVAVSGESFFINDGMRYNRGEPDEPGTFEPRGVIIGLVGARFERDDRMDSILVLGGKASKSQHPELTKVFEEFFGVARSTEPVFNVEMYKARMRISVDTLLLESNFRAKTAGKKAWTYVVGLGLGVWQVDSRQAGYYVETFVDALKELEVPEIGTLEFAWIDEVSEKTKKDVVEVAGRQGIKVRFSRRNPAEKLEGGELLVLSYAWDGNAFPGNEYWQGSLAGSGDPAAACMSTIGELHNPLVNQFQHRIRIAGQESEL